LTTRLTPLVQMAAGAAQAPAGCDAMQAVGFSPLRD
jgi:hypothetical protein